MEFNIRRGCIVAIETPFREDGEIDWSGLELHLEFLIDQKAVGVAQVGTTGESPTLTEREHIMVVGRVAQIVGERLFKLAGVGSNNPQEMLDYLEAASIFGCDGGLLVDCYYNGPSSLELRENYYTPAAEKFPQMVICPYVIPGRTGTVLSEVDLAVLAWKYPNIAMVKEATGDLERMRRTRELTPEGFLIFSGDDDITFTMLTDPAILADGVVSVMGNIVPGPIQQMCEAVFSGDIERSRKIREALNPLFGLVTVKKERKEIVPHRGEQTVIDKFRNPDAIKTMMAGLGLPSGLGRPPLGKMTASAVEEVRNALIRVWNENQWVLEPIQDFYKVDIPGRLADNKIWAELTFQGGG